MVYFINICLDCVQFTAQRSMNKKNKVLKQESTAQDTLIHSLDLFI